MAVVGNLFLIAVGRADAGIHIQDDALQWTAVMNSVDPLTTEVEGRGGVLVARQPFRLEAPKLTCGCGLLCHSVTTGQPSAVKPSASSNSR